MNRKFDSSFMRYDLHRNGVYIPAQTDFWKGGSFMTHAYPEWLPQDTS